MSMAVSDIETQDLLKSIDAKLGFIVTIMAKNANVAKNPTISKMENVDPYAEERKWIGYLCWFWDDKYDLKTAGVLEEITTIEEEFHYAKKDTCTVWKHCEPVKPDDDIIYRGE